MTRLAAFLRRLADRLNSPAPAAPAEPSLPWYVATTEWPAQECGSLVEVRERQEERLREIEMLIELIRDHDPGSGLLWLESWQLEAIKRLLEHELEQRERRFALVEERWRP